MKGTVALVQHCVLLPMVLSSLGKFDTPEAQREKRTHNNNFITVIIIQKNFFLQLRYPINSSNETVLIRLDNSQNQLFHME